MPAGRWRWRIRAVHAQGSPHDAARWRAAAFRAGLLCPLAAAALLLLRPGDGLTRSLPVTPGEYRGTTDQLCPRFAVDAGLCREWEKLPIRFTATRNRISRIRATVVEQCEDDLPPRIVEVEIRRSYRLVREGRDRAHFNMGRERHRRNAASGVVRRRVANGYLTALSRAPDDPGGEAYCYAGVRWRASPR